MPLRRCVFVCPVRCMWADWFWAVCGLVRLYRRACSREITNKRTPVVLVFFHLSFCVKSCVAVWVACNQQSKPKRAQPCFVVADISCLCRFFVCQHLQNQPACAVRHTHTYTHVYIVSCILYTVHLHALNFTYDMYKHLHSRAHRNVCSYITGDTRIIHSHIYIFPPSPSLSLDIYTHIRLTPFGSVFCSVGCNRPGRARGHPNITALFGVFCFLEKAQMLVDVSR